MSYKTIVNGKQIFGNGDAYQEWLDYIQSQDIDVDEDGGYEGEIKDFMAALSVIEKITLRLNQERNNYIKEIKEKFPEATNRFNLKGLFDFSHIPDQVEKQNKKDEFYPSLFDELSEVIDTGYAFLPYDFYLACEEKLEKTACFSYSKHLNCFKIKDGEKIIVHAG